MLFRLVSDTHFEHQAKTPCVLAALPTGREDTNTTLILAGDISSDPVQRRKVLEEVSPRFREIVYVPGNHEHYEGRLDTWDAEAEALEDEFKNVHIGRMGEANYIRLEDGSDLIYATMWAPYGVHDLLRELALNRTSDCRWIEADASGRKCTPKDFQVLYTAELADIKAKLISSHAVGLKTVVVTHHVPSLKLRHPNFPEDASDDMFMAPEAENFFAEKWAPKFWFFGHTHKAWDIQIGKTRCISNPYGYPNEKYQGWVSAKVV